MRADFVDQPFNNRFLDRLRPLITDPEVQRISIASAWVRLGGISLIEKELKAASGRLSKGRVRAVFGVDLGGTTHEALTVAIDVIQEVKIFHSQGSPTRTFHPKVYIFERKDSATLCVGSANLTAGGLANNFEAVLMLEIDKSKPDDLAILESARTWFETLWADSPATVPLVDAASIERLRRDGAIWLPSEAEAGASMRDVIRTKKGLGSTTEFGEAPGLLPAVTASGSSSGHSGGSASTQAVPTGGPHPAAGDVLAGFIPRDRWHQVGFTRFIVGDFFGMHHNGDQIRVEGIRQDGTSRRAVSRTLVNPANSNQNNRIELREPDERSDPRPARGIILVLRRPGRPFRYLHLRPGDTGYKEVSQAIVTGSGYGSSRNQSTKRTLMSHADLVKVWPGECPLKP